MAISGLNNDILVFNFSCYSAMSHHIIPDEIPILLCSIGINANVYLSTGRWKPTKEWVSKRRHDKYYQSKLSALHITNTRDRSRDPS